MPFAIWLGRPVACQGAGQRVVPEDVASLDHGAQAQCTKHLLESEKSATSTRSVQDIEQVLRAPDRTEHCQAQPAPLDCCDLCTFVRRPQDHISDQQNVQDTICHAEGPRVSAERPGQHNSLQYCHATGGRGTSPLRAPRASHAGWAGAILQELHCRQRLTRHGAVGARTRVLVAHRDTETPSRASRNEQINCHADMRTIPTRLK